MTVAMLISASDVLHRDKASWFCHIEAPRIRSVRVPFVRARFVVNGFGGKWLGAAATADETSGSNCHMSAVEVAVKLTSAKWGLPDACR
jgi:hypothetical protein